MKVVKFLPQSYKISAKRQAFQLIIPLFASFFIIKRRFTDFLCTFADGKHQEQSRGASGPRETRQPSRNATESINDATVAKSRCGSREQYL